MLEILLIDTDTEAILYTVSNVSMIRHITPSEVGFVADGRNRSFAFPHTEHLEIVHQARRVVDLYA